MAIEKSYKDRPHFPTEKSRKLELTGLRVYMEILF